MKTNIKFKFIILFFLILTLTGCVSYTIQSNNKLSIPYSENVAQSKGTTVAQKSNHFIMTKRNEEWGMRDEKINNFPNSLPAITDKKPKNTVRILHFGDLMINRYVKTLMDKNGPDFIFENFKPLSQNSIKNFDIISANLEGPFANKKIYTTKSIAFRFDPKDIEWLQTYGFNLFNLANNHILDMGEKGYEDTVKNLTDADIDFYGHQYDIDEKAMLIKEINNKKIAFIGLNDTNTRVDKDKVLDLIEQAEENADYTIINIHWGQEYKTESNKHQQDLAHWFIDNGVDIIIGHHPHVTQEIEVYNNSPIFYSLGNFVFDQYFSQDTQEEFGVALYLYNDKIAIYILPIISEQSSLKLMNGQQSKDFIQALRDKSRIGDYEIDENFYFEVPLSQPSDL